MKDATQRYNSIIADYTPSFVRDLSDGDSNIVFNLSNRYVYKQFAQIESFRREVSGLYLYQMLTGNDIPFLVAQGTNYYVAEYLKKSETAYELIQKGVLCSRQVSTVVASNVASMYWSYQHADSSRITLLFAEIQWKKRIERIKQVLKDNKIILEKYLAKGTLKKLNTLLTKVAMTGYYPKKSFTLVHGDIHLDNLLVSGKSLHKYYLIDFEHCMQAPVEMEFCNSLFWNDEKSLNVGEIKHVLKQDFNVDYSDVREKELLNVYFADQLKEAIEKNNLEKIKVLGSKYRGLQGPKS